MHYFIDNIPKYHPVHTPIYYLFCIITVLLVMMLGYIIFDSIFRIKRLWHIGNCHKLKFENYKEIIKHPNKYLYHAPYGIENALIAFNSETPYILDVIETCIERNRHLIERYKNNEDPSVLSTYLSIEIKLTSMIATSGINLMNRCRFYCQNCSKSFQLNCDNEIVLQYIINAERLHDQFEVLKHEEFKSPEVMEISKSMYIEFFNFFETVNSYLSIHLNKNYIKEETINE